MHADPVRITWIVPADESSRVGEVRRAAVFLAERAGLDETASGRAALVATELATNLVRHARDGAVLLRALDEERGVELLATDHGPGMELARSLVDGYSTGETAGEGLGAVRRVADVFDGYSRPGAGTVLMARILGERAAPPPIGAALPAGVVCTPAPGEETSGDSWAVVRAPGRVRLLVVDGLGHGPLAAAAANEAVRLFRAAPEIGPGEMLERLHDGLRATRGAAAAVAEIAPGADTVRFAGIGNIGASIVDGGGAHSLVSHNGIVGHQIRKVQELTYPWSADALLVMATDGLRTQWRLEDHPGLAARHPALVAAVLHRDNLRGRDDATALAVRGSPPTPI